MKQQQQALVGWPDVIASLDRLATPRALYFVLDDILRRQEKIGSSIEKLYANLLRKEIAPIVAETENDRRMKELCPRPREGR